MPSSSGTSSTTTCGGRASGFQLGVAMLGGLSMTRMVSWRASMTATVRDSWASSRVKAGSLGSCSSSSSSPSSSSSCLRFCSSSECWTFQQIRTMSNCAGDCTRRCATTGAGPGDGAEPGSIVTSVYGGLKNNFLSLFFFFLALFALGNMVHYFLMPSYLAVTPPVSVCC